MTDSPAGTQFDLVMGLIGFWQPIDVSRPMDPGPLRDELTAAGLLTELDLIDPELQFAAGLVDGDPSTDEPPLVATVLVSRRKGEAGGRAIEGPDGVAPVRTVADLEFDWPGGRVGTVRLREVTYVLPTSLGYEFVVRFSSPNVTMPGVLDMVFDAIMASSSLVEVD